MSNMSYCRFQNTKGDLRDCINSIQDRNKLSEEELEAMTDMIDDMISFLSEENLIETNPDFEENMETLKEELKEDDDENEEEGD